MVYSVRLILSEPAGKVRFSFAIAFVMSPENLIPPSAMIGMPYFEAAS